MRRRDQQELHSGHISQLTKILRADILSLDHSTSISLSENDQLVKEACQNLVKELEESAKNISTLTAKRVKQMIVRKLFTQKTRDKIGGVFAGFQVRESDIKSFGISECLSAPDLCKLDFRDDMNGLAFYNETAADYQDEIKRLYDDEVDFEIKALCLRFRNLSPDIKPLIYLMFTLMQCEKMERISIIENWLKSFEQNPENLSLIRSFLGVYGDVTQYVFEITNNTTVIDRARMVVSGILEDKRLGGAENIDPFGALTEYLATPQSEEMNPWVVSPAETSLFDPERIGDLLGYKVNRKLIAKSAAGLNQEGIEGLNQKAETVLRQYSQRRSLKQALARAENERDQEKIDDLGARVRALEKKIKKSFDSIIAARRRITPSLEEPGPDFAQKRKFILDYIETDAQLTKTTITSIVEDQEIEQSAHPLTIMLRLIKPKDIVHKLDMGTKFKGMILTLESFVKEMFETSTSFDDIEDKETREALEKAQKEVEEASREALFESLEMILNSEDPFLNVPLKPDKQYTIKEFILLHIVAHIPLKNGGHSMVTDDDEAPKALPPHRDLNLIPEDSRTYLPDYFGSAMLGKTRPWLLAAAQAFIDAEAAANAESRLKEKPVTFDVMLRYAGEMVARYYKAKGFEIRFYASATDAAIDVFPKMVMHKLEPDDYVAHSNQEYGPMIEVAIQILQREVGHEAEFKHPDQGELELFPVGDDGVIQDPNPPRPSRFNEVFELNNSDGTPKNAEEIMLDIERMVRRKGRPPRLLDISSKTRYGDAACVNIESDKSNFHELTKLQRLIKRQYPQITVLIDGCQSFGRNDSGEDLDTMNPDLFMNSSWKAMGVHNCAVLMVNKSFRGYPEFPEDRIAHLKGSRSTLHLPGIVAMALAMRARLGRVNTRFTPVLIEPGGSLRSKEVQEYRELTQYAIGKIETLGSSLAFGIVSDLPFTAENHILQSLETGLTPQVVYPKHRKKLDYNGILCAGFPGIRGGHLASSLVSKLGESNTVINCLTNADAIRIDFLPGCQKEDINKLMLAIEESILEVARRQIERTGVRGAPTTPSDITNWLHHQMHQMPQWEN